MADHDAVVGVVAFDMHAAAKAHTPEFDTLPLAEQERIVETIIKIVEAGAGLLLEPPCTCTVGEYMAGHKHGCIDHRICENCRCPSICPPPFGFQCAQAKDHTGFHIDDAEIISWDSHSGSGREAAWV